MLHMIRCRRKLDETKGLVEGTGTFVFPIGMTPLMLACIRNDLVIARMLAERGHNMDKPCRVNCKCSTTFALYTVSSAYYYYVVTGSCENCKRKGGELLETANARLDNHRARSSPAWFLLQKDPILTACYETRELEKCASGDKKFEVFAMAMSAMTYSCLYMHITDGIRQTSLIMPGNNEVICIVEGLQGHGC